VYVLYLTSECDITAGTAMYPSPTPQHPAALPDVDVSASAGDPTCPTKGHDPTNVSPGLVRDSRRPGRPTE